MNNPSVQPTFFHIARLDGSHAGTIFAERFETETLYGKVRHAFFARNLIVAQVWDVTVEAPVATTPEQEATEEMDGKYAAGDNALTEQIELS